MRSIAARFLGPLALLAALFSGFLLFRSYQTTEEHLMELIHGQSELALEFDLAIRRYVAENIRPVMEEYLPPEEFQPQTMSTSYVARSVFEEVATRFPGYILKFSSDDPRNPANRAGPEELEMIRHFNENPEVDRWHGIIRLNGREHMAHFSARRMKESCLRCHGDPEDAPISLIEQYGATAGFHRPVGEVIALDTVAIPVENLRSAIATTTFRHSTTMVVGLALLLGTIVLLFRGVVSRRLAAIAGHFRSLASQSDFTAIAPISVRSRDEIGMLANSFNRLGEKLQSAHALLEQRVAARTAELAAANQDLQHEISERAVVERSLKQRHDELRHLNDQLDSAVTDVKRLMTDVVDNATFNARFDNSHLKRCWEEMSCRQSQCPAYGREDNLRCWEIAGTLCGDEVRGDFAQRIQSCRECKVFRIARSDSVSELGETFNDMIIALEERQRALEESRHQAEAASRSKSQFLANMSHEIRTPMTAILGYSDLLLDPDQSPQERDSSVETIRRNGEHLLAVINDILDLSKLEAGKVAVEKVPCSPHEIALDVADLMDVRAKEKGLVLRTEFIGSLPVSIRTDPTRLRQILLNLIGNALKFTETGGVRLMVKLHDRPDAANPRIRFEVIDTGIGISPEQIRGLFKPFTQADASTTRRFGGTGLGLAISVRYAELLGGEIAVRSQEDCGTAFAVIVETGSLKSVQLIDSTDMDYWNSIGSASAQSALPVILPHGTRILLAEDGRDNQRLISFMLIRAGASVDVAENGQVACDMALEAQEASKPYDVILMDMQMPVLDGYEATRRLRENNFRSPIIALTAHAMIGDRDKCLQAGCDDYLTKPVDRTAIVRAITSRLPSEAGNVRPSIDAGEG